MLNIQGKEAKQRYQQYLERRMDVFEKKLVRETLSILRKQFKVAALLVENGEYHIDYAVEKYRLDIRVVLTQSNLRTTQSFGNEMLDYIDAEVKGNEAYQRKDTENEFLEAVKRWSKIYGARKVTKINNTTKKTLARIIKKGIANGLSNKEIADLIRQVNIGINRTRASLIARTEVHTAAVYGQDEAVTASRLKTEKEWISALDHRTRTFPKSKFDHVKAFGERVPKDEMFVQTGERLKYPGDPAGAADNIINCRCIAIYHVVRDIVNRNAA